MVENIVEFVVLKLFFFGLIKFIDWKNILVFDFIKIIVKFFGIKLYFGYIWGGKEIENKFFKEIVVK